MTTCAPGYGPGECNGLQRLLHWYWLTPWQLVVLILLIAALSGVLGALVTRRMR